MLIVTTNDIADRNIREVKGIVQGSTVKSKYVGRDILAGRKTVVGEEIRGYSALMIEGRKEATERMVDEATRLGGNAIIGVRYQTAGVMYGPAEVIAYGEAVVIE